MAGNPPVDVQQFGQSIWYDNIRRGLIESGELKKLIDEYGILGVTSNPTIFQKAIGDSTDYDADMMTLLELEPYQIFEELAVEDIQHALDLFRPVYDKTKGRDGYVSLEVSPLIANDTATTVAEAKRLFQTVNRPNLMIKIPATAAGLPAIEEALASGVNINITLIFSVKNYEQVMDAYIRALETRLERGEDVTHIASVASFFLSRIDTMIDKMLENNIRAAQGRDLDRVAANRKLLGQAAIANARLAYRRFSDIFYGERFAKLREAGAMVQRPLWASTGTKNPAYSDTMYVDTLIGRDTVNTVPPATLEAFKDHGKVAETLTQDMDDAERIMDMLAEVGVDIDQVTNRLQEDGVEAFAQSFKSLLDQVEAKRNVLATGVMQRQKTALSIYAEDVQHTFHQLDHDSFNARIWAKDGSLWKDHAPTIAKIKDRLGWLDVLQTIDRQRLQAFQDSLRNGPFDYAVLLGMGGSSLAPEVLSLTFGAQPGFPQLLVLDSTDPDRIRDVEAAIDLPRTLFIVSSKSGTTIETSSFFEYFYERTGRKGEQFVAITDPGTVLEKLAKDKGFRDVFPNPPDIGGRYSALSYFGMVAAALLGLDLNAMWESAERMVKACGPNITSSQHPGIWLGAIMGALGLQGRDKVSVYCSPSIASFGNWVEQLIAESTGKEGKGLLPVVGATAGKPHDYSTDRLIVYLQVEGDNNAELDAAIRTLREAGHPRVTLQLPNAYAIAGEFFRWEYATAVAGKILDINPFDEPNVTESKENTSRLLAHYKEHGKLPDTEPALAEGSVSLYLAPHTLGPLQELCKHHQYNAGEIAGLLAAQINGTRAGDYFALLAYVPMRPSTHEALENIARRLRHTTKRAVTLGYGPRYLHSTGQLHKGGPNNGIFLVITTSKEQDVAIPGAPYSFGVLEAAQAAGDLEALNNKSRRALRLHIQGDVVEGLQKLLQAIDIAHERRA